MKTNDILEQFHVEGRVWLRDAVDPTCLEKLCSLTELDDAPGARAAPGTLLFEEVCKARFCKSLSNAWPNMKPNRVVVFNKTAEGNWALPWHQDRVIAMTQKVDKPEYTKWTRKAGIWHCEPSEQVLQEMLFVRVHLDDVSDQDGAMEIAVGSHRIGKIPKSEVKSVVDSFEHEVTEAAAGDVLVLSMLTLHRSRHSQSNKVRRALRVDYAPIT